MLTIHQPELEYLKNGDVKLKATFEEGNVKKEIWYSTTAEYGRYLSYERGDAFILPLLFYAMKRNLPLKMEVPISERLYYTITNYLQKTMVHVFKEWHEVSIDCPVTSEPFQNEGGVGTGLSGGIDSLYTIADHITEKQSKGYRLTHCTSFNVGGHSPLWTDQQKTQTLFQQRTERIKHCAKEIGLPLVVVDSNLEEIFEKPFSSYATFAITSAVLVLQKLFKTYYVSSGTPFDEIDFIKKNSCDYDIFTLPMVSTETLSFFSTGSSYSRVEKTIKVTSFPSSYKYLDVCLFKNPNCSVCEKCLRTLLTFDVLGKLDLYQNVFNLDLYKKNRDWYIGYVMSSMNPKGALRAIYQTMVEKGQLSFALRIYYYFAWYHYRLVNKIKRILGKEESIPSF